MGAADRLNKALEKLSPIFKEQSIDPVISRFGEVDIAYPANEEEYCTLGGHAVVMIVAISEDKDELPIERAYFQLSDKKVVTLNKLGVSIDNGELLGDIVIETKDNGGRVCFENISFWSIGVCYFLDNSGFIAIDFKGERKNFTIIRGPWEHTSRFHEWICKLSKGQIKMAEHVPYDVIAKFIDREFYQKNLIKL